MKCPECDGYGYTVEPACCKRAQFECGGRGCTGPNPEQVPCELCNGTGVSDEKSPSPCRHTLMSNSIYIDPEDWLTNKGIQFSVKITETERIRKALQEEIKNMDKLENELWEKLKEHNELTYFKLKEMTFDERKPFLSINDLAKEQQDNKGE